MGKSWYCVVELPEDVEVPFGGDFHPRQAVKEAVWELTGAHPVRVSSGWAPLTPDAAQLAYWEELYGTS